MIKIDARGDACPLPVVKEKPKAATHSDSLFSFSVKNHKCRQCVLLLPLKQIDRQRVAQLFRIAEVEIADSNPLIGSYTRYGQFQW